MRCIVLSLTEQTTSELYRELQNTTGNTDSADADSDEEGQKWDARPIGVDFSANANDVKKKQYEDVLSMVVNSFGGPEKLANEHHIMLSERLLASTDYEIDQELETLERLKLKFGDRVFQDCAIMLSDIRESKRIQNFCVSKMLKKSENNNNNGKIEEDKENAPNLLEVEKVSSSDGIFSATMISYLFWPKSINKDEKFKVPDDIAK